MLVLIKIRCSCADRCIEGCGGDTATRRHGNAGPSSSSPARCVPWSGCACIFLPRQRTTTSTRTRYGTSWWPPAWCSCFHPRRRNGSRWAGARAGAGAGAGDRGSVATRCVRAAPTNSTLSRNKNWGVAMKESDESLISKGKKKNVFHKSKKGRFYGSHLWVVLKLLKLLLLLLLFRF